jgi:hypothetical protein
MTADFHQLSAIDLLGQEVIDLLGAPKDAWEIAAQLEVRGLRDGEARSRYGSRDLFDLARAIHERFQDGRYSFHIEDPDPAPAELPFLRFARHYVTGFAFSLPMAMQAATMLLWGYGLWGSTALDLRAGSAIALAFVASYIVTGGFTQAIVRRGLFYVYQQEEVLARWTALRGWLLALRFCLALLIPALALNILFSILPWSMFAIATGYYVALVILWLSWALIYLVRKTVAFIAITAIALTIVIICGRVLGFGPIAANAAGLICADALSFLLALWSLNRLARRRDAKEAVNPPRLTVLVYSTSRFFLYGLLYNTFLFADRIIAWTTSTGREDFPPYGFWLSVRYELGMDMALVVVMLLAGVVEFATQRFSDELDPEQKRTKSIDSDDFVERFQRTRRTHSLLLAVAAIPAVAIAIAIAQNLPRIAPPQLQAALVAKATMNVFAVAIVAYVIFIFALRNILLLLTLSRVEMVVRAVAVALVVDVAVGFIGSRAIHYSAAVLGFLAGAIVLAVMTHRSLTRVIENLDYYFYSSY